MKAALRVVSAILILLACLASAFAEESGVKSMVYGAVPLGHEGFVEEELFPRKARVDSALLLFLTDQATGIIGRDSDSLKEFRIPSAKGNLILSLDGETAEWRDGKPYRISLFTVTDRKEPFRKRFVTIEVRPWNSFSDNKNFIVTSSIESHFTLSHVVGSEISVAYDSNKKSWIVKW